MLLLTASKVTTIALSDIEAAEDDGTGNDGFIDATAGEFSGAAWRVVAP